MSTLHATRLKEYTERVNESPDEALAAIKNQIEWLRYVNEDEYTEGERQTILGACQRFYLSIRPLTEKYID